MEKYKKNSEFKISSLEVDECYFKYLFDAILNVEEKYITYEDLSGHEGKEEHVERVFAYELYRQWANLLEKNDEELVLNGEVYKRLNWEPISCNTEAQGVYPDLVLHSSQGTGDNQKMICEIKRKANEDKNAIFADFLKLSCYLRDGAFVNDYASFDYGVFILAGKDVKLENIKINDMAKAEKGGQQYNLGKYIEEFHDTLKRIVCIIYDGNGESLDYDTLDNILGEAETSQ